MSEPEPNPTEGQASEGLQGATQTAPNGAEGQSEGQQQITRSGPDTVADSESFFDPSLIQDNPELMKAYKQMQSAYTKKTQTLKSEQQKIDAYNAFQENPQAVLRQLAQHYGLDNTPQTDDQWEPKSWEEVIQKSKAEARKEFEPLVQELQNLKKSHLERTLDEAAPDWRLYEDKMSELLRSHPTLSKDPLTLYRLSVPPEVLESRATQTALKKLQNKTESAKVGGGSTTNKPSNPLPGGKLSFQDAVKFAQAELAAKGISSR